jgi:hypothetical protein
MLTSDNGSLGSTSVSFCRLVFSYLISQSWEQRSVNPLPMHNLCPVAVATDPVVDCWDLYIKYLLKAAAKVKHPMMRLAIQPCTRYDSGCDQWMH